MSAKSCPHCNMVLTSKELISGNCPVCQGALPFMSMPVPAVESNPADTVAVHTKSGKWLKHAQSFFSILIGCGVVQSMMHRGPRGPYTSAFMLGIFVVGTVGLIATTVMRAMADD